jgi:pimeloyl-ACP methyl ester carboxylesterase
MKRKAILAIVPLVLTSVAVASIVKRYAQWRQETYRRLQANSSIVDTARAPVEYSMKGQGPAVLLVHGSPGGYDQSRATANLFGSDHFTFIAVSRPGYLRTPLQQKSPEEQADLYAALLDELGIQKAVIMGFSGGGPSSLQFAIRHPERCSGLIMLCAVSQHYSEQEQLEAMPPIQRRIKSIMAHLIFFNNPALFLIEKTLLRWLPSSMPEEVYQSLFMHQLRDAGYKNDMEQFERIHDYPLEQITAPTFVLHGDRDSNLFIHHSELVASRVPRAKFVIDEGGDHFFYITHREKIIPMLQEFLEKSTQSEISI